MLRILASHWNKVSVLHAICELPQYGCVVTPEILLTKNYRRYNILPPKMTSEMISEHLTFLGGHVPRAPYVLCAYACDFGRTTSEHLATPLHCVHRAKLILTNLVFIPPTQSLLLTFFSK